MSFIGIVTDSKHEVYLNRLLLDHKVSKEHTMIFINEKIIDNVKNIKFETIVINREFENLDLLSKLVGNADFLIVNSDLKMKLDSFRDSDVTIISYGYNSKSTITISSVEEGEVLLCLQRKIENRNLKVIEPQEFKIASVEEENIYCVMISTAIFLLYAKSAF